MKSFEHLTEVRSRYTIKDDTLTNYDNKNGGSEDALHILWLYPDIMNLHGGRGDVMALLHVSDLLGLHVEIKRCDSFDGKIPFDWAHMLFLNSGELKCVPEIVKAIEKQRDELDRFIADKHVFCAVASSGAVLAKETLMLDQKTVAGLGLLDMNWKERETVFGDDLWFKTANGKDVMGNQIQVADVLLNEGQGAFGKVIYGRGNCGDGSEGAMTENVIFTNCLGPVLVKNPRLAADLLETAATAAGIEIKNKIPDDELRLENKSFELIRKFVENKMNRE